MKFNFFPKNQILIAALIIIMIAIFAAAFYFRQPKKLPLVEIKDYMGEKLSSVNDFRENSIKGPQNIKKDDYKLEISGLVENPRSYAYDEVVGNFTPYEKVVSLNCVEGWSVKILWTGLLVKDLLKKARVSPEAKTVIFYAYDGYATSFPVSYLLDNDILMAYEINGVTLPPERGFPFQLVAESKWGYKWIKWITKIELSADENYQGYWESRGYSNGGDLDKSFYGK